MSRHLCGMIYSFFNEIADFFSRYKNGNVYMNRPNSAHNGDDVNGFPSGNEKWKKPLVKIEVTW